MFPRILVTLSLCAAPALAQNSMPGMTMPGMTMPDTSMPNTPMDPMMQRMMHPQTLTDSVLNHNSSGTTVEPPSSPIPMWMGMRGRTMLMLHGNAFIADTQQSAQNGLGHDKLFSTNWAMPMLQRPLGPGTLTIRTMLDLEPATISQRRYPELFQQGETAYAQPIRDGQHPHNALMELAALYDIPLPHKTLVSLYLAPIGDPAIGPTAYPHRTSAMEDPIAALGHHQQDSTHIAYNVMTAGVTHGTLRLEASGFHGAEPTEGRWHFQPTHNGTTPDSIATRLTWVPTRNLAAQYSIAHITAPESSHLSENQRRQTASLMFNYPLNHLLKAGNWANTLLWGQTTSLPGNLHLNSYLAESLLRLQRNSLLTRVELAQRTTELLNSSAPESSAGHIFALTLGYDRQYQPAPHVSVAPGAQFTLYRAPDPLAPTYGRTPLAATVFLRIRVTQ